VLLVSLAIMAITMFVPHEHRRYVAYLGLGVGAIGVGLLMIHKRWRAFMDSAAPFR
jgi:hypothetical protein